MARRIIGSLWNRNNRNNTNENFEELFENKKTSDILNKRAESILEDAERVNNENKSVQEQIDNLIAESGTSDSEVLQARVDIDGNSHTTLKKRLDSSYNSIKDKLEDIKVNVREFGALGDGKNDDSKAFQDAVDYVTEKGGGTIHIPSGVFLLEKSIHTKNSDLSHAEFSHGIIFSGNGWGSVIKGSGSGVANYSDRNSLSEEALISLHGSNNVIENIRFMYAKVGLYLGQDPDDTTIKSNVNYNRINNLWFEYVGTSILLKPGYGCYYNTFENVHTRFGQIGMHLATSYFENDNLSVPNRNSFSNCVTHHSWVGLLIHSGDTNTFRSCNYEQINYSGNGYIGQVPSFIKGGIPTGIYIEQITSYGLEKNVFYGCMLESVERHIYYSGYGNSFINNFIDGSKIEVDENYSDVSTYIGAYNTNWQGMRIGGMSINTSDKNPFMIGNDFGITLEDNNMGRIFDEGFKRRRYNATDLTSSIQKTFGSSTTNGMYVWSLSGVRNIIFKATFTVSSGVTKSQPIKLKLPDKYNPSTFFKPGSPEGMYRFNVIVGSNYNYENGIGTYDIHSQEIIINAPSVGWALPGEAGETINQISFDTRFLEE